MPIEQMFTELPTVSNSLMTDIICAVQGYVSPTVLGLSTQQTLSQVYNLFQSNLILFNAGNPNGTVAGTAYQFCWDTVDLVLWVCTTSGTSSTAVWTRCINPQSNWTDATTSPVTLTPNINYVTDNGASIVNYTLPATAAFGTIIEIAGKSSGGWSIAQNAGQSVNLGSVSSTVGVAGSLASTNRYDYLKLLCITTDTTWNVIGSIGNITIV
jgi:hypothetical protein